jgi:glycosyltransferase involved in cell wall biosynthesis
VSDAPEVTVVVPTHSRWDLLSTAALPSAFGQQGVEVEVVVVDDGSTDATAERLRTIADPRLRVVRHEHARGVAQARNAGISAARAPWVAFLDDDDLWSPTKLRQQLDAAATADAVFAYGGAAALTIERRWVYSLAPAAPDTLASVLLERNVLWGGCSNVLARADVLRDLGGFDEELYQLTDWDLWIRLARTGPAAACPDVLVACIEHSGSMLLTSKDDVFHEFDLIERKHRPARLSAAVEIDRRLFTRWVALGHRRAGRRFRAARIYAAAALGGGDLGAVARAVAALFGERPVAWLRPLLRIGGARGRTGSGEPPWLSLYR